MLTQKGISDQLTRKKEKHEKTRALFINKLNQLSNLDTLHEELKMTQASLFFWETVEEAAAFYQKTEVQYNSNLFVAPKYDAALQREKAKLQSSEANFRIDAIKKRIQKLSQRASNEDAENNNEREDGSNICYPS